MWALSLFALSLPFPVKSPLKGPEPLVLVMYANKALVHQGLMALVLGSGDTKTAQNSLSSESA